MTATGREVGGTPSAGPVRPLVRTGRSPGYRPRSSRRRGVAIMMVVLILTALIAIAGPFALSMFLYERSARHFRDSTRARLAAQGSVAHALSILLRTDDVTERRGVYGYPWTTPDYDTQEEFDVFFQFGPEAKAKLGEAGVNFEDPRGIMWSARVEDEQGKINLISSPPRSLGNLIGSSSLSSMLGRDDRYMVVDDGSPFITDDDPRTVDGHVRVGEETISYTIVNGNQLEGLSRGLRGTTARKHPSGSLVYDAVANDVSSAAEKGNFRTLFELKKFLRPEDFERIVPFVTVHSYRDTSSGWLSRVAILGGLGGWSIRVRSVAGFAVGARIQFIEVDEDSEQLKGMRRVVAVRQGSHSGSVRISSPILWSVTPGATPYAQPEQIHPINVNTAPRQVLAALFSGVGEGKERVGRLEAEAIADYVYRYVRPTQYPENLNAKPLSTQGEFREMLERCRRSRVAGERFTGAKLRSLVQNAVATICFKSYGNFTIEAAGIVNTPAGEESARHVIRELVTMPVASGGWWSIASQKDFDEQMGRLVARKVVSWPFLKPPAKGAALERYKRGVDRGGRDREGYVTLATGEAAAPPQGKGLIEHFEDASSLFSGPKYITHDGARIGGGISAPGSSLFALKDGICEPISFDAWIRVDRARGTKGIVSAGEANRNGVSLVYNRAGRFGWPEMLLTVADACAGQGRAPWQGPAKFRFRAPAFDAGDWYHVALQVKGTAPGSAHVWVDGVGSMQSEGDYWPGAKLGGSLTASAALSDLTGGIDIPVDNPSLFPESGAVLIDSEVIEYDGKSQGSLSKGRRARRFTHLAKHKQEALVVPYGYSVPLEDDLYRGEATIASNLGRDSRTFLVRRTVEDPNDPSKRIPEVVAADDTGAIPVVRSDDFQDSGFIYVNGEFIFYAENNRMADELRNLTRGEFLTTPRDIVLNGAQVRLVSIAAKKLDPYPVYPQPDGSDTSVNRRIGSRNYKYASINDPDSDRVEWIRLEKKINRDGTWYILGCRRNRGGSPRPETIRTDIGQCRGQLGTIRLPLIPKGTPILPVTRLAGPQCGHEDSPRGDETVTPVAGSAAEPNPLILTHGSAWRALHQGTYHFVYRVSLDKPVTRGYSAGGATGGRLLKFPSGEFLRKVPPRLVVGSAGGAALGGLVDEIRCERGGGPAAVVAMEFTEPDVVKGEPRTLAAGASSIRIMGDISMDGARTPGGGALGMGNFPKRSGVVKIGDELIYYGLLTSGDNAFIPWGPEQVTDTKYCPYSDSRRLNRRHTGTLVLGDCVRGVLGTSGFRQEHAAGARVTFLEAIPLTRITDALLMGADRFSVKDGSGFPAEGYAVITTPNQRAEPGRGEIVGWTRKGGNNGFQGTEELRGRYGTREISHRQDDLVLNLPFRYWDRFVLDCEDETVMAFFQASHAAREAYWYSIDWTERGYHGDAPTDRVRLRVVCRFDGEPSWDERPTNRSGGLWEFTGGGEHSFSAAGGGGVIADSIEVRVYWEYLSGAWGQEVNDWKRNVRLDNLTVSFGNPLVVRKVDLLDY